MPRQSRRRRSRPGRLLLGWFVLLLVVAMLPWGMARIGSAGRIVTMAEVPADSVGVVMGTAVRPDGDPSPFLQARLERASRLWDSGVLEALIVSGNTELDYSEPDAMKRALIAEGVPAEVIVEDPAGYDTYDTCVRAKEVYGLDRVVLISQYYHLPRAVTTCRLVGVDAIAVGDATVRSNSRTWWYGELREVGAAWKMLLDVGVRRQPVLGPPDPTVRELAPG